MAEGRRLAAICTRAAAACLLIALLTAAARQPAPQKVPPPDDYAIAMSLAELLRSARAVVSGHQDRINAVVPVEKGLSGPVVLSRAIELYEQTTGRDPTLLDPRSRQGRMLWTEMDAILQVMEEHQSTIDAAGIGFKGFIPAVFGRLVGERFTELSEGTARIKLTAPLPLVRSRRALPDEWEKTAIESRLLSPDWPKGKPYVARVVEDGREALRVLVPEYYDVSCLACHGGPRGELDLTGYPKEGGAEGELGGVTSITLYR